MPKVFEQMKYNKLKKSAFDLSRNQLLTCNQGELIPTLFQECVPGDRYRINTEIGLKMIPLLAPVYQHMDVYTHTFFVPFRLLWSSWEIFVNGGREGSQLVNIPTMTFTGGARTSRLSDYLGLPNSNADDASFTINALPFRAYLKLWNDYYRDPNLETEIDVSAASMTDLTTLRKRAWEKDYFTSALPWTQRGTAQTVPGTVNYSAWSTVYPISGTDTGDLLYAPGSRELYDSGNLDPKQIRNIDSMSITINALRTASAIQRFLERSAQVGYRYYEYLRGIWGTDPKDYRLQRPEYLGGGKQPVVISELLTTAKSGTEIAGMQTGQASSLGMTNTIDYTCPEHGYILTIMSILPRTGYYQGVPREFTRKSNFDFFTPMLADIGEQPVKMQELYFQPNQQTLNNSTFGYQQRYAEYKYGRSSVHGEFRTTLKSWHQMRDFSAMPALNGNFTQCNPDTRIFAASGQNCLVQLYHDVKAIRPIPFFANPTLE